MALFQDAVREQIKLRAAIDGPTGSGKTFTALQWARILAGPDGPIGFIDTEAESAKRYALAPGENPDRVHDWDPPYRFGWRRAAPPYDPRDLAHLIDTAGKELAPAGGVLIVDSLTHFWNGEGGTLQIVDDAGRGNSFAGWKEGTPAQRYMLAAMLECPCHLIVCMRSKMEYVVQETTNAKGHKVSSPQKLGMAPEQRAGIEYEFDIVASMDLPDHVLTVTKSRINEVADKVAHKGRSHEIAEALKAWLETGAQRITDAQAEAIVDAFNAVEDPERRRVVKARFVEQWGMPSDLLDFQADEAVRWIVAAIQEAAPGQPELPAQPDPAPTPPDPDPAPEAPTEAPAEASEPAPAPATRSRRRGPLADAVAESQTQKETTP